eukprot:3552245-Rhodomonas_salina.2
MATRHEGGGVDSRSVRVLCCRSAKFARDASAAFLSASRGHGDADAHLKDAGLSIILLMMRHGCVS